jgi:uncharacterized protein
MKYLLITCALIISCTTYAIKRGAAEDNGERNNDLPKKIAKVAQACPLPVDEARACRGEEGDTLNDLLTTVKEDDLQHMSELIKRGANVNAHYDGDKTLLMHAITHKSIAMVKLLLEAQANVNEKHPSTGMTALMYAAQVGHDAIVDVLIEYGADVSIGRYSADVGTYDAIPIAADNGHTGLVIKLLELVPKKNNRKVLAQAFDKALRKGSLELVNRMLSLRANLSNQALPGSPNIVPLTFLAEQEMKLKEARLFEDAETAAKLEINSKTRTELELLIALCRKEEIAHYLKEPNGIVESHLESNKYIRTEYKQTVLMWAAMFGHSDIVDHILTTLVPLEKKVVFPRLSKDARTQDKTLDRAVRFIGAQDVRGRTALMYAILYGHAKAAQLLIPYCSGSINVKDKDGYTALDYAVQKDAIELIQLLLKNRARITISAIKEAAEKDNEHLAVSLLGQIMGQTIFGSLTLK